jgi:Mrp family chromosome partitioning ATPase
MTAAFGDIPLQGFHDSTCDEFPFVFYPSASAIVQGRAHSTEDLKMLLEEMKTSFDIIVIDLPPILLSADTQSITGIADVAVVSVLARHSLWGELMRSITILDNCGVKVISVILNRVGFIRGGYLRKSIQAFYTLGREKRKRLFEIIHEKKDRLLTIGQEKIRRLFRKG